MIEEQSKRIARRAKIQQALLLTLYGTAGLSLALLAPNAMRLLTYVDPDLKKKRNPTYRLQQALKRLEQKGLVERTRRGGKRTVVLTKKGESYALKIHTARQLRIKNPRKWDGRWRVVIFDVWEHRRGVRDKFRRALARAGFIRVQDSVWLYPYDCEEFLTLLRTELRLGQSVLYLVAEGLEGDLKYRKHFHLP